MSRALVGIAGKGFDMAIYIVYYFTHFPDRGKHAIYRKDLPL